MIAPDPDVEAAVLSVNESFYQAFRDRNLERIEALWSRQHPVSCIHPGWSAVAGFKEVIRSWRSILANPSSPHIVCEQPLVQVYGSTAAVICFECIRGAHTRLIATNLYCLEPGGWRLIHHQAGPCQENFPPAESDDALH